MVVLREDYLYICLFVVFFGYLTIDSDVSHFHM